jgi:hypothetical protein
MAIIPSGNFYHRKHINAGHPVEVVFFRELGIETNMEKAGLINSYRDFPVEYIELVVDGPDFQANRIRVEKFLKKAKLQFCVEGEPTLSFSDLYKFQDGKDIPIFELPINKYIEVGKYFNVRLQIGEPFPIDLYVKALLVRGPITKKKVKSCNCKMAILMASGCQCGGV